MKEIRRELLAGIVLLAAFALWTVSIRHIDVQNAGPNGTEIGFAMINVWFHRLTGVHMLIYTITDWLGLVPIIICMCFGVLGLVQLVKRRSLLAVGFAALNVWFHRMTGVHMLIYTITDWLGLVPIIICMCFGVLGLVQMIHRRSLLKVDSDILLLGAY